MVGKKISCYGPFKLSAKFLFSDFSHWSEGHNVGFNQLIEEARGKKCIFDIGAHIGLTTLPLANAVDSTGEVFAFEPSKNNLKFLKLHLDANKIQNVSVIEKLVGNKIDNATEFYEDADVSGMNSIAQIRGNIDVRKVEMVTIDEFSFRTGAIPDVVKIDVEGAELMTLEGARHVLMQHMPTVFLSVHPRQIATLGQSIDDLMDLILELGYEVWDIKHATRCTSVLQFGEYRLERKQFKYG